MVSIKKMLIAAIFIAVFKNESDTNPSYAQRCCPKRMTRKTKLIPYIIFIFE